MHYMANRSNIQLTEKHMHVLDYAYAYYAKKKVGPLYHSIAKNTGLSQTELERIFPEGLNSIYTWVGIPVQSAQNPCKPVVVLSVENPRDVYLDYSATTPLRGEVVECLRKFYGDPELYGNPSSSHQRGRNAHNLISQAREKLGECLGVAPESLVFTGSASEANNLAVKGIAFKHLRKGTAKRHIITSNIEHHSILETMHFLQTLGFKVTFLEVTKDGIITPEQVKGALTPETILVSIMAVNNEIGAINPVTEIGAVCRNAGVPFMVDAVQAFGKIPIKPIDMGIDLLSISGHKIYAPKGVGALYIGKGVELTPLIHGGEQEHGLRAGTENVGSIHALGIAAQLAHQLREKETERITSLRDYFLGELQRVERDFIVMGDPARRVPHITNVGFAGIDSGALLLSLNNIGVYLSTGSACTAGKSEASHVIKALGVNTKKYGTVRFSFGIKTMSEDIDYLIRYLPKILVKLRDLHRNTA
jgi:cysteine desulfurase